MTLSQSFFAFCVSVLVGVIVHSFTIIPLWPMAFVIGLSVLGLYFTKSPNALLLMLVMCGTMLGLLRVQPISAEDSILNWIDQEVFVGGQVSTIPNTASTFSSFVLKVDTLNGEKISGEIFVLLSSDLSVVQYKDYVVLDCLVEKSDRDDGYICAFPSIVEYVAYHPTGLSYVLKRAYQSFVQTLTQVYTQPAAGFITGILVGGTAQFSDDLIEQFRVTGTLHLVALSGFNISIIVGFIMILYEKIGYLVGGIHGQLPVYLLYLSFLSGRRRVLCELLSWGFWWC